MGTQLTIIILIVIMCVYCSSGKNTYPMSQEKGLKSYDEYNRTKEYKRFKLLKNISLYIKSS